MIYCPFALSLSPHTVAHTLPLYPLYPFHTVVHMHVFAIFFNFALAYTDATNKEWMCDFFTNLNNVCLPRYGTQCIFALAITTEGM
jgi:hypothetical protein